MWLRIRYISSPRGDSRVIRYSPLPVGAAACPHCLQCGDGRWAVEVRKTSPPAGGGTSFEVTPCEIVLNEDKTKTSLRVLTFEDPTFILVPLFTFIRCTNFFSNRMYIYMF